MKPVSLIKFILPAFLLIGAGLPFASSAGPVCANGIPEDPEECDEGIDFTASDLCTNSTDQGDGTCTWTRC